MDCRVSGMPLVGTKEEVEPSLLKLRDMRLRIWRSAGSASLVVRWSQHGLLRLPGLIDLCCEKSLPHLQ